MLITNCIAVLCKNIFTILAIMIPISPTMRKLPKLVRSFLVVYPYRLAPAKVADVTKNTCTILYAV